MQSVWETDEGSHTQRGCHQPLIFGTRAPTKQPETNTTEGPEMASREMGQQSAERTDAKHAGWSPSEVLQSLRRPVHASVPFGSTNDELYDEDKSRKFQRDARLVAAFAGLASALLVASWAFACMPGEASLSMTLTPSGELDFSRIPRYYIILRWHTPLLFGILACLAFAASSLRATEINLDFFCGDDLPSATLFDGDTGNCATLKMTALAGVCLVILGVFTTLCAAPGNPLWASSHALSASVLGCALVSIGTGLVAGRIALSFVSSRARCIDDYDLLIPECGADDDYKRRIYFDHAKGISDLLGATFILLALAVLLAQLPDDLGTVQVYDGILVQSSSILDGYVRAIGLVQALKALAPTILAAFAIALLAKAALRSRRFSTEWSITEVPAYSDAYGDTRAACLSKAALLSVACTALYLAGIALRGALSDGLPMGGTSSGFMAIVVTLSMKALLEIVAGLAITQVVLYLLLGEGSYVSTHESLTLLDDLEEVLAVLHGLMLVSRATFVLTLVSMGVSALAVESLVFQHPITSWGDVAPALLRALGVL